MWGVRDEVRRTSRVSRNLRVVHREMKVSGQFWSMIAQSFIYC
jgi:hypothetical protein